MVTTWTPPITPPTPTSNAGLSGCTSDERPSLLPRAAYSCLKARHLLCEDVGDHDYMYTYLVYLFLLCIHFSNENDLLGTKPISKWW